MKCSELIKHKLEFFNSVYVCIDDEMFALLNVDLQWSVFKGRTPRSEGQSL